MTTQEKLLRKLNRKITNMYNDGTLETDQFNDLTDLTDKALTFCEVNQSLPTEEEIDIVSNNKTLKYYYANEYGYTKGKRLFIEGVNWYKKQLSDNG